MIGVTVGVVFEGWLTDRLRDELGVGGGFGVFGVYGFDINA